jgi:DOPA 4,5-dioxygenase
LAFGPELIADVLPWLALNRKGLVVFLHPDTGNDLLDHTEHAIWMGAMRPLNLSGF